MADVTETETNKAHTRTGIMLALIPAFEAALAAIPGLDLKTNVAHIRRTVRAIMHLAIRMMLDLGAPPQVVAATMLEALQHELEEWKAKTEAEAKEAIGEATAEGGIAILPTKGGMLN